MTISQPRTSTRKKNPVLTSMQWDEVIEAITEARDLQSSYMDGNRPGNTPNDWAELCSKYARFHALLKEIQAMRKAR